MIELMRMQRFSKEQLKTSQKYESEIDLIEALLTPKQKYTFDQTEDILAEFKNRKVDA